MGFILYTSFITETEKDTIYLFIASVICNSNMFHAKEARRGAEVHTSTV